VDGPMSSDVISFDNGLRSSGYDNSLFYRTTNQSQNETNLTDLERHRMWLDIIDANEISCRTLVGYIEGATMDRDSYYDSNTAVTGSLLIYSLLNQEKLSTQGRSLPFDQNDIVPIGVHIPQAGTHTIALAAIDGLFNTQEIYLHDKALNIIHDIKSNPYLFDSEAGTFSERFDVIYQNASLSNPNFSLENSVKVITNEQIQVYSSIEPIESIIVYNVLGQKLKEYTEVNSNSFTLTNLQKNNTTLLLKIKLQNETISIQKAIY